MPVGRRSSHAPLPLSAPPPAARSGANSVRIVSSSWRKARSWRSLRRLAQVAPVRSAIIMAERWRLQTKVCQGKKTLC